jgi:hypothetical protein
LEELVRADPAGQCWADSLTSQAGANASFDTNVTQSGNSVTVAINPSDPSTYSGTWDGATLEATEQAGGGAVQVSCPDGTSFTARHAPGGTLSMTGTTTHLTGTLTELFDLTDQQGAGAGRVTVQYSIELTR